MSRYVSIALASFMVLVTILAPIQQVAATDSPPDVNPVMGEESAPDSSENVGVVESPIETEPPVVGPDTPEQGAQDPPVTDVPDPDANAPPVDEGTEPAVNEDPIETTEATETEVATEIADPTAAETVEVTEVVTETSEPEATDEAAKPASNLIQPNAVDPKPGECPIGEVCDGGGGGGDEEPAEVNVSMVSKTGTYYFPNAVFTITDGTTTKTLTADAYGWVNTKLTSGVTYSVSVQASGFGTQTPVSITPTETENTFSFELTQIVPEKYTVTIEVIDAQTQQPLADADVRLVVDRTWSLADSGTTNGDGIWTSKELVEGKYWASASLDEDIYYGEYDIEVNLPTNGTLQIQLQKISKSPISLEFIDATTSEPIEGVYFALAKEGHGTDVEDYSGPNGEYTTNSLEHGSYGLFAWMDGYGHVIDYRWNHPHNGSVVIELQPIGDGTVTIHAIDADSGDPIPDAMITIFDANAIEAATGKTGADGKWTSPVLPGGYYVGKVYPVRHYSASSEISIVSGNTTVVVETWEYNDVGYLWTNVIDITQGTAVKNTKVTVREVNGGVMAVGFTDKDGVWVMPQLPAGHYEVTFQRAGYYSQTVDLRKTDADTFIDIELHRPGQFKFRFWLRLPRCGDCGGDRVLRPAAPGMSISNGLMPYSFQTAVEFDPIVGATARLIDPLTMEVVAEATSDDSGLVDFGSVYEGSYTLQITGPGFQDYSQDVEISGDLEFNFVAEPANEDEGTDPDPGNPDDGTNPGTGNPDEGTDPDPGNPDDGTNPGTGNPDEGTDPDTGNPDDGSTPGTGNPDYSTDPVDPTDPADPTSPAEESLAQSGGSTTSGGSDAAKSQSVSGLPDTGSGSTDTSMLHIWVLLLAGVGLLGAAVRRFAR